MCLHITVLQLPLFLLLLVLLQRCPTSLHVDSPLNHPLLLLVLLQAALLQPAPLLVLVLLQVALLQLALLQVSRLLLLSVLLQCSLREPGV